MARPSARRLSLSSRIILVTTGGLLALGAAGYFVLESTGPAEPGDSSVRIVDAWFQSVTARTAGFNTVDQGKLEPATKLWTILLMFIGASPGSTGGGIKTSCFAVVVLTIFSFLRGQQRIQVLGRTVPSPHVSRALTIVALALGAVMAATMALTVFERQPERFLDHLFEATSAFGTVGLTTGLTPELQTPSRMVLVLTMFVGRVGPLTLLIALTRRVEELRYEYPAERVILG